MRWINKGLLLTMFTLLNSSYAENSTTFNNFTTLHTTTTPVNETEKLYQTGAYIDLPQYNGSGCPYGSLSASLNPSQTAMSVLFDSYRVEAGGFTSFDRKTCDVTIPFYVPAGYRVGIVRTDYRGFHNLPYGSQAKFKVEYFLAGENTLPYTEVFNGQFINNFLLQDTVHTEDVQWSHCGMPVNFRINTDLSVYTNLAGDETMSTLDSADITINDPAGPRGLNFYFQWEPCTSSSASTAMLNTGAILLLAGVAIFLGN